MTITVLIMAGVALSATLGAAMFAAIRSGDEFVDNRDELNVNLNTG